MEGTEQKATKHILLEIFQDLKEEEFESFKWFLQNPIGFQKIPTGRLENRNRCQTVDLMDQTYVGDSLKVTRTILAKIKRYDLLEKLPNCVPQAAASGTSDRAGAEKDPEPSVKDLLPNFPALMDQSGEKSLKPGALRKYYCKLTINTDTVNRELRLSDSNRKVTWVGQKQPYPDHPDRFDCLQLLCREALPDRCYWEVERSRFVLIAVSYRGIRRKGCSDDCMFGHNNESWCLYCSDDYGYSVWHNNISTPLSSSSFQPASNRVAVYMDRPAGSLSFYEVSSDRLKHLHTFSTTFTGEPLCAGFGFLNGSVSLCSL